MRLPGHEHWDAERYERNARFVSTYGREIVRALAPKAGERVLDVGCGDGVLTAEIAALGTEVVGIDASPSFVDAARARGVDARLLDAHDLAFAAEFDAVFTNAALHWMAPLGAVLAGVRRALRPGGRFVGEMGGFGNCAAILSAFRAVMRERGTPFTEPWHFPTTGAFGAMLREAGLRPERLDLVPRPTPLPTGFRGWYETFAAPLVATVPEPERPPLANALEDALAPSLRDEDGRWIADYVRLRFVAIAD